MTTDRDDITSRLANPKWGPSKEFTTAISYDGFADPGGQYPRVDYFYSTSINQYASGVKVNNVSHSGTSFGVSFNVVDVGPSLYPLSQVQETPAGNRIATDDTPGNERITIQHSSGSSVDFMPDGTILVSADNHSVHVTSGDHTAVVHGNGALEYHGDLDLVVHGNYNLTVAGDYNVTVHNHENHVVDGNRVSRVGRHDQHLIGGTFDHRTNGNSVITSLGQYQHFCKTTSETFVQERAEIHSGTETRITTPGRLSLTGGSASLTSSGAVFVHGIGGRIGGENVTHVGNLYTGGTGQHDGDGVRFVGTLVGVALEALTSDFALQAEEASKAYHSQYARDALRAVTAAEGTPAVYVSTANTAPSTIKPERVFQHTIGDLTSYPREDAVTDGYMRSSTGGWKQIRIDPDNAISNNLAVRQKYNYYFIREPTVAQVRAVLRTWDMSSLTSEQQQCVDLLISEGRLSKYYAQQPTSGKRLFTKDGLYGGGAIIGDNLIGNPDGRVETNVSFAPIFNSKDLVPNPRFYYYTNGQYDISTRTRLSSHVSMGRMMGTEGDPSSMENISLRSARISLAKLLTKHAYIYDLVRDQSQFDRVGLQVVESFHTNTKDLTNQFNLGPLKASGEVVVYRMIDDRGQMDLSKTFDLACFLYHFAPCQRVWLDYDTYNPNDTVAAQVMVQVSPSTDDTAAANSYAPMTIVNGVIFDGASFVELDRTSFD